MRQLFTLLAAAFLVGACVGKSSPRQSVTARETRVVVDRRIELLGILQVLTEYPLTTQLDLSYNSEIRARFAAHANHPAVSSFRSMWKQKFPFSSVPDAVMSFTPPPHLAPRRPVSAEALEAAGGAAQLGSFIAQMRDFAVRSDFGSFFAQKQPYYRQIIARAEPAVKAAVAPLETYLGTNLGDTTVVLGPTLHDGGFLSSYTNEAGQPEIYAFIGPQSVADGIADFGTTERLEPLISHEFAHSVINPLTDAHFSEVQASSHLFAALASKMKENGYSTWKQTVYEHIIRAITVRLTARSRGEAAGRTALDGEVRRGFVYVPALASKLQQYEQDRGRYPTIASFFPELLKAFA